MVHQNCCEELIGQWKRRSYIRMPERSTIQRSESVESVADIVRLRENRHCEDYPASQRCVPAKRKDPETVDMQPVFKKATTGIPGSKIVAPPGKQNVSPQKEICKPNVAVIAPCSAERYPWQPARSVYASPIVDDDEDAHLVSENRYRSRSLRSLPTSAAQKDETRPAYLQMKINRRCNLGRVMDKVMSSNCGSTIVKESIRIIAQKELQESLSKDAKVRTGGVKKMVKKFSESSVVASPTKAPVGTQSEDANTRTCGVKKMVENFSQSCPVTSPSTAPVRILPGDAGTHTRGMIEATSESSVVTSPNNTPVPLEEVRMCTRGVKRMVEKFSQGSVVPSPSNAPVRVPPEDENTCTRAVRKLVENFSQRSLVTSPRTAPVRILSGDPSTYTRGIQVETPSKSSLGTSPTKAPVPIPPEDRNTCTRGVKKMVETFSQRSLATSPNNASERIPLENVNMYTTRRVKKMVERFSQNSLVTSPHNSPVRTSAKLKNLNTSQSSYINPPVKVALPKQDQPAELESPDAKRRKLSSKVETRGVMLVDSIPSLPEYETLEEPLWVYNVDNFLKDALGSQLFSQSMSSINSESVYAENSAMSLSSSDSAFVQTRTTMDRNTFSYGSHYPRLEDTVDYERPVLQSSLSLQTSGGNNDRVNRLTMERSIQRSLVAQTSKALYLCRTLKQFKESRAMVEAERILLLASLRCQAAQDELKKCALPPSNSPSRGSITISEIVVPLKRDTFRNLNQNLCSQWFVCVLISEEKVEATEVVQLIGIQPLLEFQTLMHLSDLSCNFRARLQLYVFQAPQHSKKGKCKIARACKMLQRPTRNCLRPAGSMEALVDFRNPAFTMIGCAELTIELIGHVQPVSCFLQEVPMTSLVKGTINFRLSAHLLKAREHSGFLNVLRPVGEENAWQRWWCHLDGRALNCWNYPVDQGEKEPVYSIDLVGRQSETIVPAPRLLCSRPRTLMLESQRWGASQELESSLLEHSTDSSMSIVRHFLSCDSTAEMAEWSLAVNECIDASYLWNNDLPTMKRQETII